MKKSLKGIILASLISTQVLAAPISAWGVTIENTEIGDPQNTEEQVGEVSVPKTMEETKEEIATPEVPNKEESENDTVEGDKKTEEVPIPEETLPEAKLEEKLEDESVPHASEEQKQLVINAIARVQAIFDTGTYRAETKAPLVASIATAKALLDQEDVTDDQLAAAIVDINAKIDGLVAAEIEISFVINLVRGIDNASKIINNTNEFKDIYTPASVKAKKAGIQTAVDAGKIVLAGIKKEDGKVDRELAVANRETIILAAEAIIEAIHGIGKDNGLVRRDHLTEIIAEANKWDVSNIATAKDKEDFATAIKQAAHVFENGLTDAEVATAVSVLRAVIDRLNLVVVVSAVDQNGALITEISVSGVYKSAWTVKPPVIAGYEYDSSNNQPLTFSTSSQSISGTFGDGTNNITLVYKQTTGFKKEEPIIEPLQPVPPIESPAKILEKPATILEKPATITVTNNTQKNTYISKKKLPNTGEQTSSVARLGFIVLAASAVAFFKKRKIEE